MLAALNKWPLGLTILLALAGISMSISNTSANTPLQSAIFAEVRGQNVSLYMLAMRGGISIGSLVTGASVSLLGAREALLINGIVALVAQIAVGRGWFRAAPSWFAST